MNSDQPAADQPGVIVEPSDSEDLGFDDGVPYEQDSALWAEAPSAASARAADGVPDAPLALYRRYRPDTFAEVIGQEHVTEPLQRALSNNRVNHAYLFSGPRGCGKTTSARILARALNCAQGPLAEPCGQCRSCRDLARGGPGSIDVIEIDAASHGGVDDARELRERAFFAPVHSRYKIYIVDEAHMVTTAGFNALLKLVEEPPPHVKFVFATTEPDKVIGTIRSRTHHYPFRLVPPKTLSGYLAKLCQAEGILVEPTVLPLVVRAGAGSVRDSLSVLDQLLGGAERCGVSYAQAAGLLGYTPDSLLDETVDAFAAGDGAAVFAGVDKIIEVGQDPHRFAEDLLHRLRDLLVVAQVPDAISSGLIDVAGDQAVRLQTQAAALGPGELTRAAEVIAHGLTEMRGTTAPRLYLELMCSRVLLPGADVTDRGIHARLDRLERRLGMGAGSAAPDAAETAEPVAPRPDREATGPTRERLAGRAEPVTSSTAVRGPDVDSVSDVPTSGVAASDVSGAPTSNPAESEPPTAPGGLNTAEIRRLWPNVLEEIKKRHKFTWILISKNAQVADYRDQTLTLAMSNPGARGRFDQGGRSAEVLNEALVAVLGVAVKITTMVDPAATTPAAPTGTVRPDPPATPSSQTDPPPGRKPSGPQSPAQQSTAHLAPAQPAQRRAEDVAAARERIRPTRQASAPAEPPPEEEPEPDDAIIPDSPSHRELLSKHLGAELIGEEPLPDRRGG